MNYGECQGPKVSVIMPAYNHARFVRQAIDSVLSQSFEDLELLVTDDGSSDGTAEIIRGVHDPRLRFVAFSENRGVCDAMNDAIGRAKGEYIAVLNSDDYFLPAKLEKQVSYLDSHAEHGAVFGLPRFITEDGERFLDTRHVFWNVFTAGNRTRREWLKHFFYFGNCLCHPTILIRRSCYAKIGLFNPLLMQLPDFDMWTRLCRDFDIHVMEEELTAFRVLLNERNVSAPSDKKSARIAWEISTVLSNYVSISDEDLEAIFQPSVADGKRRSPKVTLAMEAILLGRPGYLQFGLRLLADLYARNDRTFSLTEYFELVGSLDPFGAGYIGREHQWLKSSRVVAATRKIIRRWRSSRSRDRP